MLADASDNRGPTAANPPCGDGQRQSPAHARAVVGSPAARSRATPSLRRRRSWHTRCTGARRVLVATIRLGWRTRRGSWSAHMTKKKELAPLYIEELGQVQG